MASPRSHKSSTFSIPSAERAALLIGPSFSIRGPSRASPDSAGELLLRFTAVLLTEILVQARLQRPDLWDERRFQSADEVHLLVEQLIPPVGLVLVLVVVDVLVVDAHDSGEVVDQPLGQPQTALARVAHALIEILVPDVD